MKPEKQIIQSAIDHYQAIDYPIRVVSEDFATSQVAALMVVKELIDRVDYLESKLKALQVIVKEEEGK